MQMTSEHDDVSRRAAPADRPFPIWLGEALARDPVLGPVLPDLRRLAESDAPVLISGEPGSGKELVARAIHTLSARAAHPFAVIDCAGLPEALLEAELLGVDANGGLPSKKGVFEQAGAGTVLLAEVGELPARLQDALLGLLVRGEIARLNARAPISARVRCLASTNLDLDARVAAGLFSRELYARLAGEHVVVPALRERPEGIPALARRLLAQHLGHSPTASRDLTPEAEAVLRRHTWPGNVRQLREAVEHAALRAGGGRIGLEHLPERVREEASGDELPSLRDVERRHIERVLLESHGNQRKASRILGISRWSLSRRLRKYGMQPRTEE